MPLPILFADDDLVIVDKPSGLLVHRGWGDDEVVAMTLVRDAVGKHVHPVHRLDRGTSGVLVFALHPEAARRVQLELEGGGARKRYLALVRGAPPERGLVDHPIPRAPDGPRVPAVTAFRRLVQLGRYALVEAEPRTGRLHQVRRHLKHLSCPVIGDANYGKSEHNRFWRERYGLARLALHAAVLEIAHPSTGARIRVEAPVPPDLTGPLELAGVPLAAWAGFGLGAPWDDAGAPAGEPDPSPDQ